MLLQFIRKYFIALVGLLLTAVEFLKKFWMEIIGSPIDQRSFIFRNFASIPDKDLYNSLSDLFAKMDSYLWLRDGIFKTTSKGVVPKKPIWIGELKSFDLL